VQHGLLDKKLFFLSDTNKYFLFFTRMIVNIYVNTKYNLKNLSLKCLDNNVQIFAKYLRAHHENRAIKKTNLVLFLAPSLI
jgi:hypothetical protein